MPAQVVVGGLGGILGCPIAVHHQQRADANPIGVIAQIQDSSVAANDIPPSVEDGLTQLGRDVFEVAHDAELMVAVDEDEDGVGSAAFEFANVLAPFTLKHFQFVGVFFFDVRVMREGREQGEVAEV